MQQYRAPVKDMLFLMDEVFQLEDFWKTNAVLAERIDMEMASTMLDQAGKLIGETISPLNRIGDEQGVTWSEAGVTTPDGFVDAFALFAEGGWPALCGDPAYGGMGMPKSVSVCIDEMLFGANSAFALYPGLTAGACLALEAHASESLKQQYLPRLYSGQWSATMCLTEPHAGSDLGLIKTRAVPQADGSFRVTGTKIFITGGDHDLTENILHLVLAKLPDAPEGSKGISLFLVPKFNFDKYGKAAERNGVSCGSIEHKMGIKASATCVMNFDDAKGFLIGELNAGLKCMFTMMNYERLSIGIQGTGCSEMSYQNAVAYARERLQGRDPERTGHNQVDPIIVHPDVRRMLLTMKSTIEAGRALSIYLGHHLDMAKFESDPAKRASAQERVALLTPLAKAFFTDMGLDNTVLGQQVFGGHGYIREWGQEQLVRDVRIAQIYEGTNGIQALDLIQRKVFTNRGRYLADYIDEMSAFAEQITDEHLQPYKTRLADALQSLRQVTDRLLAEGEANPVELFAAASDYLHFLGYITYAYMWLKMMNVAAASQSNDQFMEAKLETGKFYFHRILPRIHGLVATINAGADDLMMLNASSF